MNAHAIDEQLSIDQASRWFLSSGIQHVQGGVARYFQSDKGQNAEISTEITGYAVSTYLLFFRSTGENHFLKAAEAAADYLISQWDFQISAMPFEPIVGGKGYSYFFDAGIIARGLLALWRVTGKSRFLQTARECGDSMRNVFFDGHQYAPIVSMPELNPQVFDWSKWSQSPGCYQLKSALAWYELFEIDHDQRDLASYEHLLKLSLESHNAFLPGSQDSCLVMDRLHAYLYFLEGLLPVLGIDQPSTEVFVSGIRRVGHYLKEIRSQFVRADVLAQYLRIRLYSESYGVAPWGREENEDLIEQISGFQSRDRDPQLSGGFWFGRRGSNTQPFMNPWVTGFCCQALEMWSDSTGSSREWHSLI